MKNFKKQTLCGPLLSYRMNYFRSVGLKKNIFSPFYCEISVELATNIPCYILEC